MQVSSFLDNNDADKMLRSLGLQLLHENTSISVENIISERKNIVNSTGSILFTIGEEFVIAGKNQYESVSRTILDPDAPDNPQGKLFRCAETVYNEYVEHN